MTGQCPRCISEKLNKAGLVNDKQRFKCQSCGYHFTVNKLGKVVDPYYVVKALQLHLEGLGNREIERILGVSHVSVANWVKHYGLKKPLNYNHKTTYNILTNSQLKRYFADHEPNKNKGYLITPIGDKFMLLQWDRFL